MSKGVFAKQNSEVGKMRLAGELRENLAATQTSQTSGTKKPSAQILTFDANLDATLPDIPVMWEKSTCC
ncbi:hypothetical protein X742_01495 [Mesorhizobium sp. LNHC232B00]|nr:hypothetical protein X742_01495 [Mesorhizobium sp. LNHC232B00]